MPHRLRLFAEGAMCHLCFRVTCRQPLFEESAEAADFVALLREVKARDRFLVYSRVEMPSHCHLLLRTTDVPLRRSMASVQGFGRERRAARAAYPDGCLDSHHHALENWATVKLGTCNGHDSEKWIVTERVTVP
jgi:hypothetical protein